MRFLALPILMTLLVGCGTPAILANGQANQAFAASKKDSELEHERTVEVKIFLEADAFERLRKAYYEHGWVEAQTAMVSYYFDAFDPATNQFVLQHGPDGGAKFRFRMKERLGQKPKPVMQTKSRFRPTVFSNVSQMPFSARFSEEVSQDLKKDAVGDLLVRCEAADKAFGSGDAVGFRKAAFEAGATFVGFGGAFGHLFTKALGDAGGKAPDVTYAGALYNTRHRAAEQKTPSGVAYDFEFDAYQLAIAPGRMGTEYAVEADFEPGATDAETDERMKAVVLDVAGRLFDLGLKPFEALPAKDALSDPLGPNGGYMGPVAKVLAQAKKR